MKRRTRRCGVVYKRVNVSAGAVLRTRWCGLCTAGMRSCDALGDRDASAGGRGAGRSRRRRRVRGHFADAVAGRGGPERAALRRPAAAARAASALHAASRAPRYHHRVRRRPVRAVLYTHFTWWAPSFSSFYFSMYFRILFQSSSVKWYSPFLTVTHSHSLVFYFHNSLFTKHFQNHLNLV